MIIIYQNKLLFTIYNCYVPVHINEYVNNILLCYTYVTHMCNIGYN